jgi:hypothetical protein
LKGKRIFEATFKKGIDLNTVNLEVDFKSNFEFFAKILKN